MSSTRRTNGKCLNRSICRKSICHSVSELKMSARRAATDSKRCVWSQVTTMTAAERLQLNTSLHDIATMFGTASSDYFPSRSRPTQLLTATNYAIFFLMLAVCPVRSATNVVKFQHTKRKTQKISFFDVDA